ncbi:MAG: hypothetical protein U0W40_15890 [Acidimicrobiia bacterium]
MRYWQALVADDRFATIDWVNRQSSLNDHQAHIDSDGKFRAVISRLDPGVPNWLDKGDYPWGIIQMRWNHASEYPDPTIKLVPFAEAPGPPPGRHPGGDAGGAGGVAAGPAGSHPVPQKLVATRQDA